MKKSKKIGDSFYASYDDALDNVSLLKQAREAMIAYVIHSEDVMRDENLNNDFRVFVAHMYNELDSVVSKIDEYIERDY